MKRYVNKYSTLLSNTDDIINVFDKAEYERREEACKYLAKKMRANLRNVHPSPQGGLPAMYTKRLLKGVGYEIGRFSAARRDYVSEVGNRSPHAHLPEFGHGDGTLRNKTKRPYFVRTFNEEQEAIIRIMSNPYF